MANKRLMSVVDAAGFAMAASDEFATVVELQPEMALRLGHQSAARITPVVRSAPPTHYKQAEAWVLWLRDLFGPRWGGRAAA
ncbi:MAG: hypothetical protein ACT4N2_09495 [Hyphomicrobium sp.]